jgi:hypothetical protein
LLLFAHVVASLHICCRYFLCISMVCKKILHSYVVSCI